MHSTHFSFSTSSRFHASLIPSAKKPAVPRFRKHTHTHTDTDAENSGKQEEHKEHKEQKEGKENKEQKEHKEHKEDKPHVSPDGNKPSKPRTGSTDKHGMCLYDSSVL